MSNFKLTAAIASAALLAGLAPAALPTMALARNFQTSRLSSMAQ